MMLSIFLLIAITAAASLVPHGDQATNDFISKSSYPDPNEMKDYFSKTNLLANSFDDLMRKGRSADGAFDQVLSDYQKDLSELGADEMIRQGNLFMADNSEITLKLDEKNHHTELSKRGHANFQAMRKEHSDSYWTSGNLQPGGCAGGFSNTANFLSWSVSGHSCRFVLYKGSRCNDKVTFDTGGFNVVSDGHRYNTGFRSVFIQCV